MSGQPNVLVLSSDELLEQLRRIEAGIGRVVALLETGILGPPPAVEVRPDLEEMLSPEEAAAKLRIPVGRVRDYCRRGKLVAEGRKIGGAEFIIAAKIGKSWRISRAEIAAFIARSSG